MKINTESLGEGIKNHYILCVLRASVFKYFTVPYHFLRDTKMSRLTVYRSLEGEHL